MRVIDRISTAASGPRGGGLDGQLWSAAGASRGRMPGIRRTAERTSAPMNRRRYRRWSRRALVVELAVLGLLTSASAAHADPMVVALADSLSEVLTNVRNWLMGILAGLATVFLTVGGVRYLMGGGEPGEVEKAKTAFKSAGWGYGLAALAPVVVEILKGIVGA